MTAGNRAILLLDHSAELGGGELSLFDFVRSTTADVRVILFEPGPFAQLLARTGIAVEILPAGAMLDLRRDNGLASVVSALPSLVRSIVALALAMRRAPVVYANSQKALVAGALANAFARRPLIWHLHDIMTADHFSGTMRRVAIGLSNRFATEVIANSQATARSYRTAGGKLPVTVVHNGIDPALFRGIDRARAREDLTALIEGAAIGGAAGISAYVPALSTYPSPTLPPIVALFGRLSSWKGQDIAIDAIDALPGVHLVLVGAALFGETAFEATLRRQVADRGLADRVHFFGFRDDVAALMTAADVIVHCSTAPEPFGRVIAEAMMAGTPVVATAAGGALEILEDGVSGVLVSPGDAVALAAAIRGLVDDPARARALAQAARGVAEARFSLAAAVERTDAVVDRIARQSPAIAR